MQIIDHNARRMIFGYVICDAIDLFCMDVRSSAVPLDIHVEAQLAVMASVHYRLVSLRAVQGYQNAESRILFRNFARHTGHVTIP